MQTIDPFPERQNDSETADYVGQFDRKYRLRLLGQGALNYSSQIAAVRSSLVLVPFMLLRLGAEAYGFWILVLATPVFAAGVDSGLALSITRGTVSHHDGNRVTDGSTSSFLSACCGVYAALGAVCGVVAVGTDSFMVRHLRLSASGAPSHAPDNCAKGFRGQIILETPQTC